MSKKIIFQKATRIEGNANIQIEVDNGSVKTARFLVQEFRGFEGFVRGTRVEYVPHLVSRICGLCSSSHQVASIKAIEEALGVQTPRSVTALREIQVLGEWINSHALSYFFLTMPDFVGASSGIFDLLQSHPEIAKEAFALRDAGLKIVRLLGRRTSHPVTTGVGRFHAEPDASDLGEIRSIASDVSERSLRLIKQVGDFHLTSKSIAFPSDQQINFVAYDSESCKGCFLRIQSSRESRIELQQGRVHGQYIRTQDRMDFGKIPVPDELRIPCRYYARRASVTQFSGKQSSA